MFKRIFFVFRIVLIKVKFREIKGYFLYKVCVLDNDFKIDLRKLLLGSKLKKNN